MSVTGFAYKIADDGTYFGAVSSYALWQAYEAAERLRYQVSWPEVMVWYGE